MRVSRDKEKLLPLESVNQLCNRRWGRWADNLGIFWLEEEYALFMREESSVPLSCFSLKAILMPLREELEYWCCIMYYLWLDMHLLHVCTELMQKLASWVLLFIFRKRFTLWPVLIPRLLLSHHDHLSYSCCMLSETLKAQSVDITILVYLGGKK